MGLVVGFGVEMPAADQSTGWLDAGRDWAQTRLAELEARLAPAVDPVEPEEAPMAGDLSFATLMDEIAAELELEPAIEPPAIEEPILAMPEVAPQPAPEAVARSEMAAELVLDLPECVWQTEGAVEGLAAEVAEAAEPSPPRSERLAEALRLTSDAVQAWLSLVVVEPQAAIEPE